MKTCNGPCKQLREDSEFYVKRYENGSIGLRSYCKACSKMTRDVWRKSSTKDNDRNKAYNRENWEKIKYSKLIKYWSGSTWQEAKDKYFELLRAQNKTCAICKNPENATHGSGKIKDLAVDHDHSTGKVRGLLCSSCNRALGFLKEDLVRIEEALSYLHKNTT